MTDLDTPAKQWTNTPLSELLASSERKKEKLDFYIPKNNYIQNKIINRISFLMLAINCIIKSSKRNSNY